MERDRQNSTSFRLTVRLCVVSSRMHAKRRSLTKHIKKLIRHWIIRFVLFVVSICTGNN